MEYIIRNATVNDMSAVYDLVCELASFEKEADKVAITIETLKKDGFGKQLKFHCFVAEKQGSVIGMALIYPRYSTWKGAIIHLEDLIVKETFRGLGIGDALLNEVVSYAHKQGAKRINWEVLDWNEGAIKFYERKGAQVFRDWDVVQLNEEAIQNIINSR